jgi:hypothetical protein
MPFCSANIEMRFGYVKEFRLLSSLPLFLITEKTTLTKPREMYYKNMEKCNTRG